MPAQKFTKRAKSKRKKRQWQHVYSGERAKGVSKAEAIIRASGVVKNTA